MSPITQSRRRFEMLIRSFIMRWGFLLEDLPPRGYRVFALAYVSFCGMSLLVLAEGPAGNPVDRNITEWVHERPILRQEWCRQVSRLGDGDLVRKACWASVLLLLVSKKWEYVPALIIGVLGEMALSPHIQDLFGRVRPEFPAVAQIGRPGFPSGHTVTATVFCGFWILFLLSEYRNKSAAKAMVAALAVVALSVGLSRVFLLAHWTTDVVGGFAFATVWVLLCFWVNQKMQARIRSGAP